MRAEVITVPFVASVCRFLRAVPQRLARLFTVATVLAIGCGVVGCSWVPGGATPAMPGRLAYVRHGDLWVRQGEVASQVTRDGGVSQPRWSPDGAHLLFLQGYPGEGKEMWLYTVESEQLIRLGTAETLATGQPRWSPDGTAIAFIPWQDDWRQPSEGVAVVKLSGELDWLLPPGSGATDLAYHPDGWLAVALRARPVDVNNPFTRTIEAQRQASIVKLTTDRGQEVTTEVLTYLGSPPQPGLVMFIESAGGLRFDPRGEFLTFFAFPNSASLAADGVDLMVVPAAGGEAEHLVTMLAYDDFVAWSPDGQKLAVIQGGRREVGAGKELVVLRRGEFTPLAAPTPASSVDLTPTWSPDSTIVATSRGPAGPLQPDGRESQRRIWLTALKSGDNGPLLLPATDDVVQETPVWGDNGRGLLFVQRPIGPEAEPTAEAELWWTQPDGTGAAVIAEIGPADGYYGHLRWRQQFDWYWRK